MAERDDKVWFSKATVIGWITTIILSISGAYVSMWTQLSSLKIEVEILKVRTEHISKMEDEDSLILKDINAKLNGIHQELILKADKKFSE